MPVIGGESTTQKTELDLFDLSGPGCTLPPYTAEEYALVKRTKILFAGKARSIYDAQRENQITAAKLKLVSIKRETTTPVSQLTIQEKTDPRTLMELSSQVLIQLWFEIESILHTRGIDIGPSYEPDYI